jgi:Tfp pilus assembly protein PilN
MWWERWIPGAYLTRNSVCAVECVFGESEVSYQYTILQNRKNKVEVVKQGSCASISEVISIAKKSSSPISLTVNGKGVMVKKIIFSENDSLELKDLLNQHLSAIPFAEFYIQFYKNEQNSGHITLCRKEQVDNLIEQFIKQKAEIANVFIGPLVCNALFALTKGYNRLTTSTAQLELTNGFVEKVESLQNAETVALKIEELNISSSQLVAFAAGFSYLTRQHNYITGNAEIETFASRHSEKIKVKLLLFCFIAVLFVVSGINSVFFFQKFEENSTLEVELNLYESKNTQITKLLEDYQKKKSLIEQAGIFESKKISVYADKIAASLPQDIVLRELYFNPEEGETEEDSLMNFSQNELIIKGNCTKSLLLNDWVNVLKSQSFVKSVNLENFVFNSEGHLPNFVLKLKTE